MAATLTATIVTGTRATKSTLKLVATVINDFPQPRITLLLIRACVHGDDAFVVQGQPPASSWESSITGYARVYRFSEEIMTRS